MPLLSINNEQELSRFVVGSDADIGGYSTAKLELQDGVGRFHGNVSLDVPPNSKFQYSGYAAFRSRQRGSSLFGTPFWDTSLHRYLALRVKGDSRKYFVNMQSDGVVVTDLFQHRLFLQKPGEWETVLIPFKDFILTNNGVVQENQVEMLREKIRTIGISVLDRQAGPFELFVDWIKAVNTPETEGVGDESLWNFANSAGPHSRSKPQGN